MREMEGGGIAINGTVSLIARAALIMSGFSPPAPMISHGVDSSHKGHDAALRRMPFGIAMRNETDKFVNETFLSTPRITVTKYAARHWAVWIGEELIAVTVYKKGAARVAELLRDFSLKLSPNFDLGTEKIEGLLQAEGSQK